MLDKNLPDDVKSFIMKLNEKVCNNLQLYYYFGKVRNSEEQKFEVERQKFEVEKQKLEVEIEKEYLKHKISNITTITQTLTTSFNQLIPRAVIGNYFIILIRGYSKIIFFSIFKY